MKRLSTEKKKQLLFYCLLGVLACVGIYYLLIGSFNESFSRTQTELDKARADLDLAQTWMNKRDVIQADKAATSATLLARESQMAGMKDVYAWSYLLLDAAKQGHNIDVVEVTRPRIGALRVIPDFPYLSATFTLRGQAYYHDLGRFVAAFENKYPLFRIENLVISKTPEIGIELAKDTGEEELLFFQFDIVALTQSTG